MCLSSCSSRRSTRLILGYCEFGRSDAFFFVYIKIAEYCGFVQSNLKDIAGQRECPSGLEEPLAGLCFAASCCADLPELQDLRDIFAMKYGKQIVSSAQDLKPNHHVNQQFLDNFCAQDPSETEKQALLEEITTKDNVMQGHERDTHKQDFYDFLSSESFVDPNEYKQSQEGIDCTMIESKVIKDESENEELLEVNVVQEAKHIETVCKEDLAMELANELANRKRTLEDRPEIHHSALKRAYRKRNFWQNKATQGEENGGEEHAQTIDKVLDFVAEVCSDTERRLGSVRHDGCEGSGALQGEGVTAHLNKLDVAPFEDLRILQYVKQAACSQPPQRCPPPPPPPRRAPPPPPSLRVMFMPSSHNGLQVDANTSHPLGCSTMPNHYHLETYGSHVHPRLPKYEDLVANFTSLKQR